MLLVITLVLALIPLLGIVLIFTSGSLFTVDGLFMTLILLAMSGIVGLNVILELRKGKGSTGGTRGTGVRATAKSIGGNVDRGRVESVQFFESNVGQTNKSVVTLADGAKSSHMLIFSGDMRNSLPVGKKVEIAFREAEGGKILLNVDYF